jgi:sugar/nucleoside kinase (ribokinase family)
MNCTSFLAMNRFRNGDSSLALPQQLSQAQQRPLRVIATGTLFVTHTLCLQSHPAPSSITRAHAVSRSRGGSAPIVLAALAQLGSMGPHVFDAQLVAPLAANDEGRAIMRELENEGIGLRYCKIWEGANVPSAWVLQSGQSMMKTPTAWKSHLNI